MFTSKHDELDLSVFESSVRQTIAGHLLDLVPVLAKVPRRLLLRCELRRHAAGLACVTVRDLKKIVCGPWPGSRRAGDLVCIVVPL
jgi:hypothetical protein